MKIRPVGAGLFHVDGHTDMTTPIVVSTILRTLLKLPDITKTLSKSRLTDKEVRNSAAGRIVS